MSEPVKRITHYESVERAPIAMVVVNCYELYGIKVYVELDRQTKKASIVEWDGHNWTPKKFVFTGREKNYMNGWIAIFRACEQAIQMAKKELDKFEDDEAQKILDMHVALSKVNLEQVDESSK